MLGWAIHIASPWTSPLSYAGLLAAVWTIYLSVPSSGSQPSPPLWLPLVAGALAWLPAAAILPKPTPDGVRLAAPIFDHAKIALIDAIARLGLPAQNPFYGGPEIGPHLAYYYWWHLTAAQIERAFHITGWTADAALTWFTAYATLMLIAGIAWAQAGRATAALALLLAIPGSLRPFTTPLEHAGWLAESGGLGGWVNQASWAPQHLAAAGCLVLATLTLARLSERPTLPSAATLACLVAAAFGSSVWIGGIVAALALPAATLTLAAPLRWPARKPFLLATAAAAFAALTCVSPLLKALSSAATTRAENVPITLALYPVFPSQTPAILTLAGLPLLMLIEFPVLAVLAPVALRSASWHALPSAQKALLTLAATSILVCWCARSTIENNDLGWRAIVPALLILTPYAAAAALHLWHKKSTWRWIALLPPLLGAVGVWPLLHDNFAGQPTPDPTTLPRMAPTWIAIDRLTPPDARIASDPRLAATLTLWPANIAWALQANRASCYSGWATTRAFAPLPAASLYATEQRFWRLFDGAPYPTDLATLTHLTCTHILLTPDSPAWRRDPFAAAGFQLVATDPAHWRLYRVR